jgi:hypothetical protein
MYRLLGDLKQFSSVRLLQNDVRQDVSSTKERSLGDLNEHLWSRSNAASRHDATACCQTFGEYHHLAMKTAMNPSDIVAFLAERGHQDIEVNIIAPSIEDCFIDLEPLDINRHAALL